MPRKMNRRTFIKKSGKVSAALSGAVLMPQILNAADGKGYADISIVTGEDYFSNTLRAVDLIGGINRFIQPGDKVGLLINSDFENEGTYVDPDIALAAVKMIHEAGAAEITCLQVVKESYWQRSPHYESMKELLSTISQVASNTFPAEFNEDDFIQIKPILGAISLNETEVVKAWLECDAFVNIPIGKHHMTTLLTGALKNIMGVSTRKANVTFHLGSGERNNPEYLAQCIVDQYRLKKTSLCIVDMTSVITDNGPSGPGTLLNSGKILAGTDVVALDALTSTFLGYAPDEILTTVKANEAGIGNMDFSTLNIVEVNG